MIPHPARHSGNLIDDGRDEPARASDAIGSERAAGMIDGDAMLRGMPRAAGAARDVMVEVAVPLPVSGRFHYRVPARLARGAQIGARVLVRFGPRKVTGVIVRVDTEPPPGVTPVDVSELLDAETALPAELVELCLWIADYYEAPPGEVIRGALPAGSGVAARDVFALTARGQAALEGEGAAMVPRLRATLAKVAAARELPNRGLSAAFKRQLDVLRRDGLVEQREQRDTARTRLKRERIAQLAAPLDAARDAVRRAPRRAAVIEILATGAALPVALIERQAPGSTAALRELAKAGLIAITEREVPLGAVATGEAMHVSPPPTLTDEQSIAVHAITEALLGPSVAPVVAVPSTALGVAASDAATSEVALGAAASDAARSEVAESSTALGAAAIGVATSVAGVPSTALGAAASDAATSELAESSSALGATAATAVTSGATPSAVALVPSAGSAAAASPAAASQDADRDAMPAAGSVAVASPAAEAAATVGTPSASAMSLVVPATSVVPAGAPRRAFAPFLLHGVTGSGKTEVYLRVIAAALEAGKTALVLVPEISLTPQLAARFRARFGDLVAILHSGLSEQARLGEWSRLRRGEAKIAVGARSAVFAPLAGLGVIVVDEEHDGSFKQDEGVRYHARDVALVRAQRAGAVCVLGSATPSLETSAHAAAGNYRRLVLTQRPTARPMPAVEVIDLRTYRPDGDAMLSAPLRAALATTLAAGDQSILFLNRRGFATFVLCRACGHSFRCPHCSVSLTYHRHSDRMNCHYCGYAQRVPEACPSCHAKESIERKGLGTEKVAEAVAEAFPGARVARLDRDVASGAKVEAVLARVARREVDILVGTQMVTKGHDFPGVTLVGVLCADTGLNLPDFRASERTFQLLAQVAGRAGRGDRPGRVIVQTYRPEAPAVVAAAAHDYERFFAAESAARAELGYPPHGRLIAVRIDGPDEHEVAGAAKRLAQLAEAIARRPENAERVEVRGPVPAPLERLRNRTRWQVWLRSADRHALRRVARGLAGADVAGNVRVGLDVDPISAM